MLKIPRVNTQTSYSERGEKHEIINIIQNIQ